MLSVAKCQFGYDEIKCLGHMVNRQGVTVQAGLVDRILTLRAPSNQKELLTFLSMIGIYPFTTLMFSAFLLSWRPCTRVLVPNYLFASSLASPILGVLRTSYCYVYQE